MLAGAAAPCPGGGRSPRYPDREHRGSIAARRRVAAVSYFCSSFALMKATTAAVSAAVRRDTVPCSGPSTSGDQPKLRTFHGPLGSGAAAILGISFGLRSSSARRVSLCQLTQSVLKKWLFVGST